MLYLPTALMPTHWHAEVISVIHTCTLWLRLVDFSATLWQLNRWNTEKRARVFLFRSFVDFIFNLSLPFHCRLLLFFILLLLFFTISCPSVLFLYTPLSSEAMKRKRVCPSNTSHINGLWLEAITVIQPFTVGLLLCMWLFVRVCNF